MTLRIEPTSPLDPEIMAMRSLIAILTLEQGVLASSDPETLGKILQDKQKAIDLSNELTKNRIKSMIERGFTIDQIGLEGWIQEKSGEAKAHVNNPLLSWLELKDLAEKAQELNRINGMLINKRALIVSDTLVGIRGGSVSDATYGPNGKKLDSVQSRSLVVG